jgi:tripartite-type tricarboxylate transporter receptor subunit TctC
MRRTRFCAVLSAALFALAAGFAHAQAWPAKPVSLIVPFAPGGTTDIIARLVAQKLTDSLGQNVVVENRPGAGGTLGAGLAAKATPDGYTLFEATVAHTMATSLYKKLPYDFERDLLPVTVLASVPNILIVNNDLPVHSVKELIEFIKANPGKVAYGSAGNGSTEHLSGALFASMAGVTLTHVPYKGGAPMMTDLIGGQIQMAIETSASALPHIKSGRVRALAVSTAARAPALPDVPTLAESGLKGFEVTTWYGLLVPKGTPKDVVAKLYAQTTAILKSPEMIKLLKDQGAEPGGMSPEQFSAFIQTETAKWARVVQESGATID